MHLRRRIQKKSLRLTFSTGQVEVVEADRYDTEEDKILLYRNDVVIAEYPASTVREVVAEFAGTERGPGLLASLAMCVMYFAIFKAVGFFLWNLEKEPFSLRLGDYGSLVQLLVAWPITLWRGLRWRSLWWSKMTFREAFPLTRFPLRILPALLIATFGGTILAQAAANLIPPHPLSWDPLDDPFFSGEGLRVFFTFVLLAPLAEELFFRGLVLHGYLTRYSRTVAVVASALLFAVFHLNVWQAAFAFPIGLSCGWLFLRTSSLIPCIICHVLANFSTTFLLAPVALAMGYRADSPEAELGLTPAPMLGLAAALLVVGGFVLWWQLRNAARE